jgi:hypothetical protein
MDNETAQEGTAELSFIRLTAGKLLPIAFCLLPTFQTP